MNIRLATIVLSISFLLFGCKTCRDEDSTTEESSKPVPIGENSFVYNNKVYKLINNELLQVADLEDTSIRKLRISSSELKDLGKSSLDYIKEGAEAKITSVYRGNYLYYKLTLSGINDLKEKFSPGKLTINFTDNYGFTIYSADISSYELIGEVSQGVVDAYEYNGKIEITMDAQAAINSYSISSTIKKK